jgi:hypothetical protein
MRRTVLLKRVSKTCSWPVLAEPLRIDRAMPLSWQLNDRYCGNDMRDKSGASRAEVDDAADQFAGGLVRIRQVYFVQPVALGDHFIEE